ncbi:MAG: hypothetical protein HFG22_18160 [Lachnospiraceae bacterium]|nr:hypothetical protein [Lachnospiraceae bacterium]
MYSSIIEIKKTVPNGTLADLRKVAEEAFSNRAGSVKNSSNNPYRFVFKGGEDKFGCLELGMLALKREREVLDQIDQWHWVDDEDPGENCDILKVLAMPVY